MSMNLSEVTPDNLKCHSCLKANPEFIYHSQIKKRHRDPLVLAALCADCEKLWAYLVNDPRYIEVTQKLLA